MFNRLQVQDERSRHLYPVERRRKSNSVYMSSLPVWRTPRAFGFVRMHWSKGSNHVLLVTRLFATLCQEFRCLRAPSGNENFCKGPSYLRGDLHSPLFTPSPTLLPWNIHLNAVICQLKGYTDVSFGTSLAQAYQNGLLLTKGDVCRSWRKATSAAKDSAMIVLLALNEELKLSSIPRIS